MTVGLSDVCRMSVGLYCRTVRPGLSVVGIPNVKNVSETSESTVATNQHAQHAPRPPVPQPCLLQYTLIQCPAGARCTRPRGKIRVRLTSFTFTPRYCPFVLRGGVEDARILCNCVRFIGGVWPREADAYNETGMPASQSKPSHSS